MEHAEHAQRMRVLHKRQRVAATTETTVEATTTAARGRARTSATTELVAVDTSTTAASQHERPAFLTASTRTTATTVAVAATTPSTTASTADDTTTSATSTTTARGRATTTSSSTSSVGPVSNVATSSTRSTGFNEASATPVGASPKSNSSSSSSHGGAVAGAIIAVIAVLAIGVGFFVWRKRRNNRLARDGLLTAGGGGGFTGGAFGAGGYKKQDENGRDAWDGRNDQNDQSGAMTRDDSSLFGGREKTFSQESFNAPVNVNGGNNGYGATSAWNQPPPPSQQQAEPPQAFYNHNGPAEPAWTQGSNAYPPMNQTQPYGPPSSTTNLLHPSDSMNALPASLAAGSAAGAAGIGAARLLAAQSNAGAPTPTSGPGHYDSIEQRELQQELDNRRQSFLNKTQPPTPNDGAVVAAAESSPFGESEGQGQVRIVRGTFDPSLDDELVLYPGDKVQVLMKYDDGWALGLNLSSGVPPSKGVFPFDCLGEQVAPPHPSEVRSPGVAAAPQSSEQRSLSPINPANVPLPPPTPTLLSPISEDEQPPLESPVKSSASSSTTREGPPQLAPFERSDSPLSAEFPSTMASTTLTVPTSGPPSSSSSSSTFASSPAGGPRYNNPSSGGGSPTKTAATKLKRHSSLIASRDADLFVALGEVLDKEKH